MSVPTALCSRRARLHDETARSVLAEILERVPQPAVREFKKLMRKRMLRAWLLWLLAAACCALAFAFTHAGAALAALCVPVLAALAGFVVLRCSRLPALSLRLPAGGRKDGMIAGEIVGSRRAPGRVLCRIEVRNDLTRRNNGIFRGGALLVPRRTPAAV